MIKSLNIFRPTFGSIIPVTPTTLHNATATTPQLQAKTSAATATATAPHWQRHKVPTADATAPQPLEYVKIFAGVSKYYEHGRSRFMKQNAESYHRLQGLQQQK